MRTSPLRLLGVALLVAVTASVAAPAGPPDWLARSDANAQLLIDVWAEYDPEGMGQVGVEGLDEEVTQISVARDARQIAALEAALAELRARREQESAPAVRQDLDILIDAARQWIERLRLEKRLLLPYRNLPEGIFLGIRFLLDDQVAPERRPAAVVRLRRYAGLDEGYVPIAEQFEAYLRHFFDQPGLLGPYRDQVERDLAMSHHLLAGISELFERYQLIGWEDAYAALGQQLAAHDEFIRAEILPRAREDFRMPPELYAARLKDYGVEMPVAELASRARVAFKEIQNEMQALALLIARERELESGDYRDVIRKLKQHQLEGESILEVYRQRIQDLERICTEHRVVTVPDRDLRIRRGEEAEAALLPGPHMNPPRLFGNTGEMGEFVVVLKAPDQQQAYDDFTSRAVSWTLTAHEGRPGHEMQFAALVEQGVSKARSLFAFNSANAEGWALYVEAEIKPYMPLEGQLVSLQFRLLRAARAFLDPGLQSGEVTPDQTLRVLTEDVLLSPELARFELERYTARGPGQATSYFFGYTRLMELRAEVEQLLGEEFDRRQYHDFLLASGLLPLRLLRQAALRDFVGRATTDHPAYHHQ